MIRQPWTLHSLHGTGLPVAAGGDLIKWPTNDAWATQLQMPAAFLQVSCVVKLSSSWLSWHVIKSFNLSWTTWKCNVKHVAESRYFFWTANTAVTLVESVGDVYLICILNGAAGDCRSRETDQISAQQYGGQSHLDAEPAPGCTGNSGWQG